MYSTSWCGDCRNAKRFLNESGVEFSEIDIDQNAAAAQQVIEWSGGRRVIPTFHILTADQNNPIILHNPKLQVLSEVLQQSGVDTVKKK
jgi:glutaredoxin